MSLSLIICTYQRPQALLRLLESVKGQTFYPNQIIIVDGSLDHKTQEILEQHYFPNLEKYLVGEENRGLTKQRNFGIGKLKPNIEIVAFLDDDTVLEKEYFKNLLLCFENHPDAIGVGGVAVNQNRWKKLEKPDLNKNLFYCLDGYFIKESSRNVLRNYLGLQSSNKPGIMPPFSHGRTYSYPLNGKDYQVDLLIGMSMAFRKDVLNKIRFSQFFEGYGLYEDADFSLRALKFGNNYISTTVRLNHYHEESGRPNKFRYGKMVVRNGYYVWRIKYPKPNFKNQLKWHIITLLLLVVRLGNVVSGPKRLEACTEAFGRMVGWTSLFFSKPKE